MVVDNYHLPQKSNGNTPQYNGNGTGIQQTAGTSGVWIRQWSNGQGVTTEIIIPATGAFAIDISYSPTTINVTYNSY
jgi:hypothetical protein